MNKDRKFPTAARLGAGLLLLGAALTAWAVTFNLTDGTNSVNCTAASAAIDGSGNISATVTPETSCNLSGSGEPPPPPPPGNFTLTVNKTGSGAGTVTSSPAGINCGADCSQDYSDGTAVALTAAAATGSTFAGWSGACTGTGACNLSMTANRSVTATFTADGGGGDCGALPPDVTIVDTGTFSASWPQQTVFPTPQNIAAYKVVVPAGVSAVNTFSTARTSAGLRAKLLVVSTCPGVLEPVGGQSRCMAPNPQETSSVVLTTIQNNFRCNLTPGNTYYVNAASKASIDDTGFTCSTTTNCSYFVSRTLN